MIKNKIRTGLISQKTGNKTTIFDGEKSVLYTFNETAAFMFDEIKIGRNEKEIIDQMTIKYKVDIKQAENDLKNFILELKTKKIID